MRRGADGKSWIDSPASARACPQHRGTISYGLRMRGMHACSRSMWTNGLKRSRGGCSDFWRITRMGLRMNVQFSFITKRVDVSMGCQPCESHELVMAAVAAMRLGHSLGQADAHESVLWARAARQGDPTTRPTFPQSHACYNNYMDRDVCHSVARRAARRATTRVALTELGPHGSWCGKKS